MSRSTLCSSLIAALLALAGCADVYDEAPSLGLDPGTMDFGATQSMGAVLESNVVLTNEDARDISLLEVVVDGDTEVFAVTTPGGAAIEPPILLQTGETYTVMVTFLVPDYSADFAATATFTYSSAVESGGCNCDSYTQEFGTSVLQIAGSTSCDLDGDGYDGLDCEGDDCDDDDPAVHPGAEEVCDQVDNDCDGDVDDGFDADGDGYLSCEDDCDDGDDTVHPGAEEICDGVDNDCDGDLAEDESDDEGEGYNVCDDD